MSVYVYIGGLESPLAFSRCFSSNPNSSMSAVFEAELRSVTITAGMFVTSLLHNVCVALSNTVQTGGFNTLLAVVPSCTAGFSLIESHDGMCFHGEFRHLSFKGQDHHLGIVL